MTRRSALRDRRGRAAGGRLAFTGSTAHLVARSALRSRIANLLPPSSGDYSRCEGTEAPAGYAPGGDRETIAEGGERPAR
jgi:hypothetical protein